MELQAQERLLAGKGREDCKPRNGVVSPGHWRLRNRWKANTIERNWESEQAKASHKDAHLAQDRDWARPRVPDDKQGKVKHPKLTLVF